jgi:peroxiredoxin
MNKNLILYIASLVIITSCKSNSVSISGTLINPVKGNYIYLDELMSKDVKPLDSMKISEKGAFNFKIEIKSPAFYLLKVSERNFLTMVLEPGDKMIIRSYYDSLNYPISVEGSKGTVLMNEYNLTLRKTINKLSHLSNIYRENIKNPRLPEIIESLDSTAQSYLNEINSYTKNYIDDNLTSLVSLIALYQQVAPNAYVLNPTKDYKYYLKVDSTLSSLYPGYEPVVALHEQIGQLKAEIEGKSAQATHTGEGTLAPDIILPTPTGDTIKLSSTRGSFVLLDFWASWCSPCRQENPNLVKAYNLYHRKGFQIYQVSLDKTKDAWVKGIDDDQLGNWIHVSDIQYWNSKAVQLYRIESIPSNFLLDKEGHIIATNLRGEALQTKLAELFR